ncbi:MAG: tRNA dihydrouridine(20/20a) synthase DusA, partial [Gammaproteobacteria bacterium]
LVSRRVLLYTEMVTTGALLHGEPERFLAHHREEHPLAIQLGGSEPADMARCARLAEAAGFDEVNMNVGCPSDRVQSGRFGACLMTEPERVADCIVAMGNAVDIPVTVKTRIGVDENDSYEELRQFVDTVAAAGCRTFVIHARKAWLHGLSPRENREVPPLDYGRVHRLKVDCPELNIVINGGIRDLNQVEEQLAHVDGVMIGREAYRNPFMLAEADARLFGDRPRDRNQHDIVRAFLPYVKEQLEAGVYLSRMTRHLLGLFQGMPGARAWRRHLSENACRPGAGAEVIERALTLVPENTSVLRQSTSATSAA